MNSVTQQDWTSLGADLQQELRQQWIPSQPLQIKCAVRDGSLLVLAEHLLHVEPKAGETFASLEQEIRRLIPELLKRQKAAAPQGPSDLPVQLFLRIAGYQQPYTSHKFQLDLRRSPIADPPTPRLGPLVGPTVGPSPIPTVENRSVIAEDALARPATPAEPIVVDQPTIEPAGLVPEQATPAIETTLTSIPADPPVIGESLRDDRLEYSTIAPPGAELVEIEPVEIEPVEIENTTAPALETVLEETDESITLESAPEASLETRPELFPDAAESVAQIETVTESVEINLEPATHATPIDIVAEGSTAEGSTVESSPALETELPEAEAILETSRAIEAEAFVNESETNAAETNAAEAVAPEPLTFEDLFSGDPTVVESAAADSLDRSTIDQAAIVEDRELIEVPEQVIQASPPIAPNQLPEAIAGIRDITPVDITLEAALTSAQEASRVDLDRSELGAVEPLQTTATELPESPEFVEASELSEPVELIEPIETPALVELAESIESAEPIETLAPIEAPVPIEPIEALEPIEPVETIGAPAPIETTETVAEVPIELVDHIPSSLLAQDQAEPATLSADEIQTEMPIAAEFLAQESLEQDLAEVEQDFVEASLEQATLQIPENDSSSQVDPLTAANLTGTIWQEPDLQEPDLQEPEFANPIDSVDRSLQIDADWTATETHPDLIGEGEATVVESPEITSEIPEVVDRQPQTEPTPLPTVLPDPWAAESVTIGHDFSEPALEPPSDDLTHVSEPNLSDPLEDADLRLDSEDLLSEDLLPEDSIEIDNLETIEGLTEEQTIWAESDRLPDDGPEIDSIETTESLTEERTVWAESDHLPDDSIEIDSIETLSVSGDPISSGLVTEQAEPLAEVQPKSATSPPTEATGSAFSRSSLVAPLPTSGTARSPQAVLPVDAADQPRRPFRWSASSLTLLGAIGAFIIVGGGYLLSRPCVVGGCEPLRKAQQLSQEALQTARTTDSALEVANAYKKLNEANYLLSTIPSWSSHRQEAQALLNSYEDQAMVLAQVVEALEQANQAALKSQNPPHPLQKWREIQWLWREAITRLEKIPSGDPLYDLAQRKLQEYQNNLSGINQRVAIEQQAQDRITAARQIEQLGNARALAAKSPTNWQETASTWTTAIDQLRQIPQGTMAYDEAQQLIAIYQPKLTEANQNRAQEQTAVDVYSQALNAAKQAQTMEQQSQWIQAATYWQAALSYAQQVPIQSTYYNQVQTLISSYRQSLQQAQQNSQRSVAVQAVKPSLEKACAGSPRLCTYTLSPQSIRVQFTALYDKTVDTLINKTELESGSAIPAAIVDQVNGMLRTLADVGEVTQVPIELYDSRGVKLGIYTPSLSGYVPQQ